VFTSHHITKLIAAERVAQLQAEAAPQRRDSGERRLARWARRLSRAGSNERQPVAPARPALRQIRPRD
jgi:hypothetical protein